MSASYPPAPNGSYPAPQPYPGQFNNFTGNEQFQQNSFPVSTAGFTPGNPQMMKQGGYVMNGMYQQGPNGVPMVSPPPNSGYGQHPMRQFHQPGLPQPSAGMLISNGQMSSAPMTSMASKMMPPTTPTGQPMMMSPPNGMPNLQMQMSVMTPNGSMPTTPTMIPSSPRLGPNGQPSSGHPLSAAMLPGQQMMHSNGQMMNNGMNSMNMNNPSMNSMTPPLLQRMNSSGQLPTNGSSGQMANQQTKQNMHMAASQNPASNNSMQNGPSSHGGPSSAGQPHPAQSPIGMPRSVSNTSLQSPQGMSNSSNQPSFRQNQGYNNMPVTQMKQNAPHQSPTFTTPNLPNMNPASSSANAMFPNSTCSQPPAYSTIAQQRPPGPIASPVRPEDMSKYALPPGYAVYQEAFKSVHPNLMNYFNAQKRRLMLSYPMPEPSFQMPMNVREPPTFGFLPDNPYFKPGFERQMVNQPNAQNRNSGSGQAMTAAQAAQRHVNTVVQPMISPIFPPPVETPPAPVATTRQPAKRAKTDVDFNGMQPNGNPMMPGQMMPPGSVMHGPSPLAMGATTLPMSRVTYPQQPPHPGYMQNGGKMPPLPPYMMNPSMNPGMNRTMNGMPSSNPQMQQAHQQQMQQQQQQMHQQMQQAHQQQHQQQMQMQQQQMQQQQQQQQAQQQHQQQMMMMDSMMQQQQLYQNGRSNSTDQMNSTVGGSVSSMQSSSHHAIPKWE